MLIFRIRVSLNEDQYDFIKKLDNPDNPDHTNDDLKSHIYQQIIDQIRNINSEYY